jgi:hypothetical protein
MNAGPSGRVGIAVLTVLAALLAWPATGRAQLGLLPGGGGAPSVTGQARAAQVSVAGGTVALADTGTLSGIDDARHASMPAGGIPAVLGADTLHAATVGGAEQTSAEASLANVSVTVAGTSISAGFAMAGALALADGSASGTSSLEDLIVNGVPVTVTGSANQVVDIPGGRVVVNEQRQVSAGAISVSALRVIVNGVADVAIASATAGH